MIHILFNLVLAPDGRDSTFVLQVLLDDDILPNAYIPRSFLVSLGIKHANAWTIVEE